MNLLSLHDADENGEMQIIFTEDGMEFKNLPKHLIHDYDFVDHLGKMQLEIFKLIDEFVKIQIEEDMDNDYIRKVL